MRVFFLLIGNSNRNGIIDGNTIRYGGVGSSGTDQSTIMVAEYLAGNGFEVVIASENSGYPGRSVKNVVYTNMEFKNVPDTNTDILVNCLWFDAYHTLPVTVNKSILLVTHCPYIYGFDNVRSFAAKNNARIGVVHLSEWCKNLNATLVSALAANVAAAVIPNPLMCEIKEFASACSSARKQHQVVFHAHWSRGGQLAFYAYKAMNWHDGRFICCDYTGSIQNESGITSIQPVDKQRLLQLLAESDYFIYPQTRHFDGEVHKDTFACVIAEALLMGCITLAYPVSSLTELYQDCVVWLDFPEHVADLHHIINAPLSKDMAMTDISKIVDKLNFLEMNPDLKNNIRQKGMQWVQDRYNINRIGSMWANFLKSL